MKATPFTSSGPVVGILGGGQLAQMLNQSAISLGLSVRVLVQKPSDALPGLAGNAVTGDWNDPATAREFSQSVDVVTLENEFINPESLAAIEQAGVALIPSMASIRLIQDKWHQKVAMMEAGLAVTPSLAVNHPEEVARFAEKHGWPVVLKRRHLGYDGKGNATIDSPAGLAKAWADLHIHHAGLYVEAFCPFEQELAVMVCRSTAGATAVYPVVETVQEHHVCRLVRAPGNLPTEIAEKARGIAVAAIEAIGGLGVMGVELFLLPDGAIVVNELAPRVHNSGHYTIEACDCSQFENHLRAILGWPLGSTAMIQPAAVMINLLGQGDGPGRPDGWTNALAITGAHLHIYGKSKSAPGRKMGHITVLGDTIETAERIARSAAESIQFG